MLSFGFGRRATRPLSSFLLGLQRATMALSNPNDEGALIAVWQLVAELSEQLNANRAATAALQAQAGVLKVCLYSLGCNDCSHPLTVNLIMLGPSRS